jgi:GxxExxY protein
MDTDSYGWEPKLTEVVIGSAFEIANVLGAGFWEKVYARALIRELALRGYEPRLRFRFRFATRGNT